MNEDFGPNKNANNKVDILYNIWLGRKNLFQTFEPLDEFQIREDIKEVRALLDDDADEEEKC